MMDCRFGLCDIRRNALSVTLSPDHKFAAVSDSVGRILLIDTIRGCAIRLFKGYREAQCAFIPVLDEKKSKHTRIALFLVIYSGKKGTLEVFTLQKGRKIVTFTAAKHSRLVYIDYSLMGFTDTTKSRYVCPFTCILIDYDGKLKEILVPFHFALSEENSSRVRDLHLFKRLQQTIKVGEMDSIITEAVNTCKDLQTSEIKLQCLNMLISRKEIDPETILICVQNFLQTNDSTDDHNNELFIICNNVQKLVQFYLFVTKSNIDKEDDNTEEITQKSFCTITMEKMEILQKLLNLNTISDNQKTNEVKVTFNDENDFTVSDFLSIFKINRSGTNISLKNDLDEALLYKVALTIFKKYVVNNSANASVLKTAVINSALVTEDLLKLLLLYWVNRPLSANINLESEMKNLSSVVLALAQTANVEELTVNYNKISVFWEKIREILEDSSRPFPALTAAIICQNIAQLIEREREVQVRKYFFL